MSLSLLILHLQCSFNVYGSFLAVSSHCFIDFLRPEGDVYTYFQCIFLSLFSLFRVSFFFLCVCGSGVQRLFEGQGRKEIKRAHIACLHHCRGHFSTRFGSQERTLACIFQQLGNNLPLLASFESCCNSFLSLFGSFESWVCLQSICSLFFELFFVFLLLFLISL